MFAHAQTKNSGVSGRNVLSRSARGPVSFVDVSLDGSYITIENTTTGSKAKVDDYFIVFSFSSVFG